MNRARVLKEDNRLTQSLGAITSVQLAKGAAHAGRQPQSSDYLPMLNTASAALVKARASAGVPIVIRRY